MKIPFARAPVSFDSAAPFLREALDNGWLTTGPLTERFTAGVGKFLGTSNIVAVSSCTAALQIALAAAKLEPGDEVILPAHTFIATFETVELAGLTPVLADIDPNTWNISLESAAARLTGRTRAIICVPFAGNPLPLPAWRDFADKHQLTLILDNAHALEAKFQNKFLHEYADYSCYSFYATKNLTTAEGGAIVCPADKLELVRTLSLHGMSRAAWKRYAGGTWRYDIVETGYKANLTDIHAAIGLAQLDSLQKNHARRVELAQRYQRAFADLPLRCQNLPEGALQYEHGAHLYCISLYDAARRDEVIGRLQSEGIGTSVHFVPIYEFSHTKNKYSFRAQDFPHTHGYFAGAISLPLYPTLSDAEQDEVIRVLRELFLRL